MNQLGLTDLSSILAGIKDPTRFVGDLSPSQKEDFDLRFFGKPKGPWSPDGRNDPQTEAYDSEADLLLYGGAAGGGKSDLLCGVALTRHTNSVIFRKQSTDLRGIEERLLQLAGRDGWNGTLKTLRLGPKLIELGHLDKPGSEESWRGRPHDFIGFDEGGQLSKYKVRFVLGWLRSADPKQRRRAIIATNPPTGGEGEWLVEWFAPWLDPKFSNPATQGELRWCVTAPDKDGTIIWVDDGRPVMFTGYTECRRGTDEEIERSHPELVQPQTRTFIQSLLKDNPYLADTGYRAQIQSLPEPLRTQLLNGDFIVGREDHEWQVIPTAWVKAAQERWQPRPPEGAVMTAMGVDIAQGGADRTVIACRFGPWYAPLQEKPGVLTPTGSEVATFILNCRRDMSVIVLDVGGGYGGAAKMRLEDNEIKSRSFNGAGASSARTEDRQIGFVNKRAEATWRFREALDPDQDHGSPIALPPDPQILADLTAFRWKMAARGIQIESKEDLKKPERLGRSPDKGDAIIMAWSEGNKAYEIDQKRRNKSAWSQTQQVPKFVTNGYDRHNPGSGWMSR